MFIVFTWLDFFILTKVGSIREKCKRLEDDLMIYIHLLIRDKISWSLHFKSTSLEIVVLSWVRENFILLFFLRMGAIFNWVAFGIFFYRRPARIAQAEPKKKNFSINSNLKPQKKKRRLRKTFQMWPKLINEFVSILPVCPVLTSRRFCLLKI